MKGIQANGTGAERASPHSRKPNGEDWKWSLGFEVGGDTGANIYEKRIHGIGGYSWRNLNCAFLTAHNIPRVTPNRAPSLRSDPLPDVPPPV